MRQEGVFEMDMEGDKLFPRFQRLTHRRKRREPPSPPVEEAKERPVRLKIPDQFRSRLSRRFDRPTPVPVGVQPSGPIPIGGLFGGRGKGKEAEEKEEEEEEEERLRGMSDRGLSAEVAVGIVHRLYGPDKLNVIVLEIVLFVAYCYGVYEVIGMVVKNPTSSTPTLSAWAVGTVVFTTVDVFVAFIAIGMVQRLYEIRDNRYQAVANGGISVVMAVLVVWAFYSALAFGKRDVPSVNEQLTKLLFPVLFPWQDVYIILGGVSLLILVGLYYLLSSAATQPMSGNRLFFHSSFSALLTGAVVILQNAANHGTVVCDMRSSPWILNYTDRFGIKSQFYSVMALMNLALLVSFALQFMSDVRLSLVLLGGTQLQELCYAFQLGVVGLFFWFNRDAALGVRERVFSPGTRVVRDRGLHLGYLGFVALFQIGMMIYIVVRRKKKRNSKKKKQPVDDIPQAELVPGRSVLPTVDFEDRRGLKTE